MGGRTAGFKMSDEAEEMQGGYAGTVGDLRAAENLANKRVLFQKNKLNDYIDEQRHNDFILAQIGQTNTMRKQSDYYKDLQHQNINRYAGQNYLGVTVGRQGTKLMSIEAARAIIMARQAAKEETQKLQNGGVVGIDSNILPEGALHARKHNMENAEHITKKGIPVVDLEGKQ